MPERGTYGSVGALGSNPQGDPAHAFQGQMVRFTEARRRGSRLTPSPLLGEAPLLLPPPLWGRVGAGGKVITTK